MQKMSLNFEAAFDRSPAPSMILNRKFEFVAANPAYLTLVNKTSSELLGNYVFDVFPEEENRVQSLLAVFEETLTGQVTTFSEIPFRIPIDGVITEQWWTAHHALLTEPDADEPYLIQYSENVTGHVKAREMRNALLGELQHRVGNIFAIVGAIARQTGRTTSTITEFLREFESRVAALVKVNRHLTGENEDGDTLASVVEYQLTVHASDARQRISAKGPEYPLSMLQAQAISMAIHELSTNSMKYGVIGQGTGEISITWDNLPNEGCLLTWTETGVSVNEQSTKPGYGTMLLTTILPRQLGGSAVREFSDDSFLYSLEIAGAG